MKNTVTLFMFSLLFSLASCQDQVKEIKGKDAVSKQEISKTGTPEMVKSNFKKKYPGENDPDWKKDANGNYEAHFKMKGIHYRADFSPDGNWIETETSIKKKDLPQVVIDIIDSKFSDYEITEVEKVDHSTKGEFFDVEFKQKGKNKDVEFKASGEIIN